MRSRTEPGLAATSKPSDRDDPNGRLPIGISDQNASVFSDPLFHALPIQTARLITPWNSVYTEPERLAEWLDSARAAGMEVLVAFEHARGEDCPNSPCRLPTASDFGAAFRVFEHRYPWVRLITPWNEPNHRSQPTATKPRQAAAFYNVVRGICSSCRIVAGDVLDAPGMVSWLGEYRRGLVERPSLWGLHNYYDTTYFRTAGIEAMTSAVDGDIWLTESGGIVSFRTPEGDIAHPYDEERAADSVSFLLRSAARFRDRLKRAYVYQWRSPAGAYFDAGLLSPHGLPRPGYFEVRNYLGLRMDRGHAASSDANAKKRSESRIKAERVRVTARGLLRVPVVCARPRGVNCRAQIAVEGAEFRNGPLMNGKLERRVLRPRRKRLRASPGSLLVSFRLPRPVYAVGCRFRSAPRFRIRLTPLGRSVDERGVQYVVESETPGKARKVRQRSRACPRTK